jgi:flagellar hook-associated protein 3 FlgL
MMQSISTSSFSAALRYAVSAIRRETAQRQTELQTGAMADAGLDLGASIGRLTVLSGDVSRISSIVSSNNLAAARLETTQASLDAVRAGLETLAETFGAGVQTTQTRSIAAQAARNALAGFTSALNASVNGEHVFAGINSSEPPFADASGMQAVTQVDAAFLAYFGFDKSDAATTSITSVDFNTFLETAVAPIFESAVWESSITSAANDPIIGRITLIGKEAISVTANEPTARSAFYASAIAAAFLDQPINQDVAQTLVRAATEKVLEASQHTSSLSAKAGLMQARVAEASDRMSRLSDIFEKAVSKQTAVDPYETSLRLNELLNTLESTILVSQRIQNLSFVKLTR